MPPRTIRVEFHRVGDVITGGWCEHCLLPSQAETGWVMVDVVTLRPIARGRQRWCVDCGNHELVDQTAPDAPEG